MRTEIIEFDWTPWEADVLDRLVHHRQSAGPRLSPSPLPMLRANRLALEHAAMAAVRSPGQPRGAIVPTVDDDALDAEHIPPAGDAGEAQGPAGGELFAAVRRHGDARFCRAFEFITERVRRHAERDVVITSLYPEVRGYLLWCAPGQPELFGTKQVARGNGWARTVLHLGIQAVTCWLTRDLLPEEARDRAGLVVHYEVPHILPAFGQRLDRLGRVGREHVFVVAAGDAARLGQYFASRALRR